MYPLMSIDIRSTLAVNVQLQPGNVYVTVKMAFPVQVLHVLFCDR